MLAGWMIYLGQALEQEDPTAWKPDEAEVDTVGAIYQESGMLEKMSDEEVQAFVRERVIPLLLKGPGYVTTGLSIGHA